MKVLFLTLLLAFAAIKADDPVSDAALFVDGFLRGALSAEIGRVDDCLTDGDSIVADVGKLITDIENGFDLLSIITDIGSLLKDVPNSIQDCEALPDTVVETFKNWEGKMTNPTKIAKIVSMALLFHKKELEKDANGFLENWKSGNFETSGQLLGDIPHILFDVIGTQKETVTPFDVGHFLDGFLTAALQSEVTEVEACLTDADALLEDIQKFVTDIEAGFDLLPLIGDLGELFTQIPKSIKDCDEFKDDVEDVLKIWEAELKNPVVIAKILYIALADYEDRLKTDATDFVSEWKGEHFELSGTKLGDIPHVLFDLCPAKALGMSSVEVLVKGN
mmetsp:Transcript_9514/g.10756  ORF Transcript_9514/g.10756 Transcript_9514/m.10756 type:complete len:334 (+) Transcript_9514:42-1043(+)